MIYVLLLALTLTKCFLTSEASTFTEQVGRLNATFPCGDFDYGQSCKIPLEYCDTIIGSCMPCNTDICRENSQQSCNIYCDDIKAEVVREKSKNHLTHLEKVLICVAASCFLIMCLSIFLTKPWTKLRFGIKQEQEDERNTQNITMITSPSDDSHM